MGCSKQTLNIFGGGVLFSGVEQDGDESLLLGKQCFESLHLLLKHDIAGVGGVGGDVVCRCSASDCHRPIVGNGCARFIDSTKASEKIEI